MKPDDQGATSWNSVTAQGSEPEFDYGYARNPCLKRPHLGRTAKRRRWYEISGNSTFYAVDEKVFLTGLNCSNYRGINYRLISGTLGLCLTGVKREPTVRGKTYRRVNVGSAIAGLKSRLG